MLKSEPDARGRVDDMLCSACRMLEQQRPHRYDAGRRACGILRSNQPEGLITKWQRCMLCIVLCRCKRRDTCPHHQNYE